MKTSALCLLISLAGIYTVQSQNNSLEWAKSFGGNNFDFGEAISMSPDGNIVVGGYFEETVDFDPGPGTLNFTAFGEEDIVIMKLTPTGNLIWAKQIGGTDVDNLYSIAVDASGNIIATGSFQGTCDFDPGSGTANLSVFQGSTNDDMFIVKLDGSGNYLWSHGYGSVNQDVATYVTVDADQDIYMTGFFRSTIDFDPSASVFNVTSNGLNDAFFCKYDAAGNFEFAGNIGGAFSEVARSVFVDADKSFYLTGNFESACDFDPGPATNNLSSQGDYDGFLVKLDSVGQYRWARRIGSTQGDFTDMVTGDRNGHLYLTGYFRGTVDLNPGAGSVPAISAGSDDFFISKFDTAGIFIWGKSFGSLTIDRGFDLFLGNNNTRLYSTGRFAMDVDFDPGPGTEQLISAGTDDGFILALDTSGNYVWVKQVGGTSSDMGRAITHDDATDRTYITGFYNGTSDFDPNAGVFELVSNGGNEIFVLKLGPSGVGLDESSGDLQAQVSPNPFQNSITIKWPNEIPSTASVGLYDISGREIKTTFSYRSRECVVNFDDIDNGVYVLRIKTSTAAAAFKLIRSN